MPVSPIPAGFHTVTPYVFVENADAFVAFAREAFGAVEQFRSMRPDGGVAHAQITIGDSVIELSEAHEGDAPMLFALHLYVADADATYARAIAAGAASIGEMRDTPYGDRGGEVCDPFGNQWYIATHVDDAAWDAATKE